MSATEPPEKGKKRSRTGEEVPPVHPQPDQPPNAQDSTPKRPRQKRAQYQKMPRLPKHAKITKRPLHRPALPSPFSSSLSQKTLYITSTSPFIPSVKRIRSLLSEISKRAEQSSLALSKTNHRNGKGGRLEANGRLDPKDVERSIASGVMEVGGAAEKETGEKVYVKASGKAIPRALEVGNYFQGQGDCRVRVSIGSVRGVDDIELGVKEEEEGEGADGDGEAMDVDGEGGAGEAGKDTAGKEKSKGRRKGQRKDLKDEDVPETRIRTMSIVTVAISLR